MVKRDNFDDRYRYYFYGSNKNNISAFDTGLEIVDENIFQSSLTSEVFLYGLEIAMKRYANIHNFDFVLAIKIPTYYLGWVHRDGVSEYFVPLLKDDDVNDGKKNVIPELMYVLYSKKDNHYIYNSGYKALFDPNGLHYLDRQLATMYKFGEFDLYRLGVNRNIYAYEELKIMDEKNHCFEKIIKHYSSGNIVRTLRRIKSKIF